ncbi:MAG: CBS domain-containing protein [Flavobacteriaceae bacterium]|nr:CBS domain-containing protein [Muriicola sp.]NNC62463.1 CBS domain-containing protein [Eudoraea sp.]NNK20106.1 CBS domain-containing protein [Flavobacteriaceae bacterium]MBT8291201.1 CBS domain-containing protein [Muriicola sp.]NNK36400.1 CBS domain-containing protein [Eudoraea sp.]
MGEKIVRKINNHEDKKEYIDHLLKDIETLELMLNKGLFSAKPIHIGAEQEFCLVDESWDPSSLGTEILEDIADDHFTSELNKYNLELNLDPLKLEGSCFSDLHKQLNTLMTVAKEAADKHKARIILTGILPTISHKYLQLDSMTPVDRYKILNEAIQEIRKDDIELHIKGVDEVNLHHDTILYEGCNTSFQAHLQIDPEHFAESYNWAQAIAGPVLSICANSPLLLGKELWAETRIALFTQSVDTRRSTFILNEKESRVSFGQDWVTGTIADFYKNAVVNFRSLVTTAFNSDSLTEFHQGEIPKLKALSLHNGTTYRWNRLCYGITDGKPHVRIENRYMPSGPTTEDEIANMMFWVGLMHGRPKSLDNIHTKMDFKDVKGNFFSAARYGMSSQFYWEGKLISSRDLLLDHLLPMAFRGLYSMNIEPRDAEHYLSIIERRIKSQTGSRWMINAYRKLLKENKTAEALKILVATMYERQQKRYAIDAWQLPRGDEYKIPDTEIRVGDLMNTRTITAQDIDSPDLVLKMMLWNNIHHAPILDNDLNLAGLLSWVDVEHYQNHPEERPESLKDIMKTDLITVTEDVSLSKAKKMMEENNIRCLPVVKDKKLVGIITSNDL